MNLMNDSTLDHEEQEILESYERGEWIPTPNLDEEKKKYSQYATNTLAKTQSISIRVSRKDLLAIKAKAIEEGVPYQTLIGSAIHKYAAKE
jgi:predicted DNA binding CopG/RHH family protein